jgi:hypothetical protein
MQPEHQKHLGGPSAESLDLRQTLDDRLVRQRLEQLQLQPAVDDPRRQIAHVADLLATEANAPERRVTLRGDGLGVQTLALGKQRDESSVNRRRRLRRQLLADDGADERREVILALTLRHPARTDPFDGRGEHRVAPHEQAPSALVVGVRHLIDTVSVTCA